jgi:hypothetical protein
VDAIACQRIQRNGEGSGEGLPFTGPHLGDLTLVQGDGADELNVEVALTVGPLRGFPGQGKRLRQEIIELLAVFVALPEVRHGPDDLLVGERLELLLHRIDVVDERLYLPQFLVIGVAHEFGKK